MTLSAEDRRFLSDYDPGAFERPSVTVDVVCLTAVEGSLRALLVKRAAPPHKGRWALPGTFVQPTEGLDEAAARALADKTGLSGVFSEQLYTFGAPGRDPRTRVISVAYYALVSAEQMLAASAGAPAGRLLAPLEVPWSGAAGGPVVALGLRGKPLNLAFDHALILGAAVARLRGKLDYSPVGFQLLPERFSLMDLQRVHEMILGEPLKKGAFRKQMLTSGRLEDTGQRESDASHRPAKLFRFAPGA